jgi:hypothetical protein
MQLALLQPEPFVPLPLGSGHYVAALQNKSGELDALRHTSEDTWSRFTPLVQIVGRRSQPAEYRSDTVSAWVGRVSAAVGSHPLFLDLMRLRPNHPVTTTKGTVSLLDRIYWAARRRGLMFVPVLWVGESDAAHVKLVRDAVDTDRRGAALRYHMRTLALPAAKQATYLGKLLSQSGADVTNADLIIDLDFLDADVEIHPDDLGAAITGAMGVGDWRSVVLLGTSMPSMLSCIPEGTVGSLARKEWEIWTALSKAGLQRMPTYGDYGIQHNRPPDGGGPSMRASIRYTTDTATLVARGEGSVLQEGAEQYIGLCQDLVALQEFAGGTYSWGDGIIDDCANGRIDPGAQNMWRGAGTSHHLRFVTDQLRKRRKAA